MLLAGLGVVSYAVRRKTQQTESSSHGQKTGTICARFLSAEKYHYGQTFPIPATQKNKLIFFISSVA